MEGDEFETSVPGSEWTCPPRAAVRQLSMADMTFELAETYIAGIGDAAMRLGTGENGLAAGGSRIRTLGPSSRTRQSPAAATLQRSKGPVAWDGLWL